MRKNQLLSIIFLTVFGGMIPLSGFAASDHIEINGGDTTTETRNVRIELSPTVGAREMRIGNDNLKESRWIPVQRVVHWELDFGSGEKEVEVQFKDVTGRNTEIFRDTIRLYVPSRINVTATLNDGDRTTKSRYVKIESDYTKGIEAMAIANENQDIENAKWMTLSEEVEWVLSPNEGQKTVTIRYRDMNEKFWDIERTIFYEQPADYIQEGSLLKGQNDTVYYLGYGGRIHPFLHSTVYNSYFPTFSDVRHISNIRLRQYTIGEPVCVRQGTWLLKFRSIPRVYAVEPGCELRPIRSEAEAFVLYGERWGQRIVELDPIYSSYYRIREHTVHRIANDRDRDGVDKATEKTYGTSDNLEDSDGDRLSDYEEIFYWFTDPMVKDTDGDGVMDGLEIMQKRSPAGSGAITEIPEGMYEHPYGSVIYRWWSDKKYYYAHQDGEIYFLSTTVADKPFLSNKFQRRFIVSSPFKMRVISKPGWHVSNDHVFIRLPLTKRANNVLSPL